MNVAVVGAGIIGRLAAWRLARLGHAVTLFDQHDLDSRAACSWAAAGLLAPAAEGATAGETALAQLGARSLTEWPAIAAALPRPVTVLTAGTLAAAHEPDLAELLEFRDRLALTTPALKATVLDREALVALEPHLAASGFTTALHLEGEGCVNGHEALKALAVALPALGVALRLGAPVERVAAGAVTTAAGTFGCDAVLDARGLGAQPDAPELRGVRGEIIEVRAPELALRRPLRVLHQRYPIYIVPRGPHTFVVGATCLESESRAPVTVKAALELLGAAYAAHPAFRYAEITGLTANCRPAYPDNLPRVERRPGLVRVNGLYRHGFLLAPLVTDLAVRLLAGDEPAADEALLVRECS